jgi:hypothetical protein
VMILVSNVEFHAFDEIGMKRSNNVCSNLGNNRHHSQNHSQEIAKAYNYFLRSSLSVTSARGKLQNQKLKL